MIRVGDFFLATVDSCSSSGGILPIDKLGKEVFASFYFLRYHMLIKRVMYLCAKEPVFGYEKRIAYVSAPFFIEIG